MSLLAVREGTYWKRNHPGRETVEVQRVWDYFDEPSVRAHPTTGGRPLVAPVAWFVENYHAVPSPRAARGEGEPT